MIIFEKITFKNFLSVGNTPVTVNLNDTKTTLIHGTNGSGKSLVLDAITYALFGKPHRRINLSQVINSQNKKELLTEISFTIGKKRVEVLRGMKPKILQITVDGKELEAQAAEKDSQAYLEKNILKMNQKTFSQVVILGSSNFIPFMQLGNLARRECVEDFLDIKVFSTMSVIAKERLRGIKDRFNDTLHEMETITYKMEVQGDRVKEMKGKSLSDIEEWNKVIKGASKNVEENTRVIDEYKDKDRVYMEKMTELLSGSPKEKLDQFNNVIIKMENKAERLDKERHFYENTDDCPTCGQLIGDSLKQSKLFDNTSESSVIMEAINMAKDKLEEHQTVIGAIAELEGNIQANSQKIFELNTSNDSLYKSISFAEEKISSIKDEAGRIEQEVGKLQLLCDQYNTLAKKKDVLLTEIKDHDVVVGLLKDSGIKTQIIRKYLPVMNKFIRKYLTELDFPIHFVLDDQFNESVSSPMHQDFSYASFSEGQKARIDLALMFVWREIGRLKNSVSTNILILDEVFSSSLDEDGKEKLLQLLRYSLDDNQRVVVVDHTLSQGFQDKFEKRIQVSRIKGFSQYT